MINVVDTIDIYQEKKPKYHYQIKNMGQSTIKNIHLYVTVTQ